MRAAIFVVSVLGSTAMSGCVFHGRHSGHSSGEASVGVGLEYTYFPSHHAYYHETSGEWFVIEGDAWVSTTVRPVGLVITTDTPWVSVSVEGPSPYVRYEDHSTSYPSNWERKGPKGPPPGRGWRK